MSVPIEQRKLYTKSCPGWAISKTWVIEELKNYLIIPDNTLIKSNTKKAVFFVKNNIKYPIPDWQTLIFYWGGNIKIKTISNIKLINIKTGKLLPSIKNL